INLSDSRIGQEIEYFIQNLTNGTYASGQIISNTFDVPANGYYNLTYNLTLKPKHFYCTDSNVKFKVKLDLAILEKAGSSAAASIPVSESDWINLNSTNNSATVVFKNLYLHHNVTVNVSLDRIYFEGVCDSPLKGLPHKVTLIRKQDDTVVTPPPPPPHGGGVTLPFNCWIIWGY
ncbi:MAG: hypothetical protein N3E37_01445, partial [Candidatus Micrarchaeota archaeon]|nr:hypothetical protein [Candidatus Micrarchaeota archaeon]